MKKNMKEEGRRKGWQEERKRGMKGKKSERDTDNKKQRRKGNMMDI